MIWIIFALVWTLALAFTIQRILAHLDNISKQTTEMNAYLQVLVEESDRT